MHWKLDQHRAGLSLEGFSGAIDLTRPADGIVDLIGPDGPLVGSRLMGVLIPGFPAGSPDSLLECHRRGGDLAVAYRESAGWPARLDVRWRLVPLPAGPGAIELILSVRTYSLTCQPILSVLTTIRAEEVLAIDPNGLARSLTGSEEGWVGLTPANCLVFRRGPLSYVQMVHPNDFSRDELLHPTEPIVPVQFRHRLFSQPLEKGVIVRTRLRGFLLPRDDDLRLASRAARQFADSEAPLD